VDWVLVVGHCEAVGVDGTCWVHRKRSVGMRLEGSTIFARQGIEWDEERCRLSCA